MKIPQSPPSLNALLEKTEHKRLFELLLDTKIIDEAGRYLHWDEIRYKPTPPNKTTEEWWLGLRFARRSAAQTLPFKDKNGNTFFYTEPPEMKNLLRFIDMNAGGFLGSNQFGGLTVNDGHRYMRRSLAEEPFASSFIEGAVTTRTIAKKLIFENRRPATRDERMVFNNYKGMEFIKSIQHEQLTPQAVLELHHIMTEGTLDDPTGAGRLRTEEDNVNVVDDSTGEILHAPPLASTLPERLDTLCTFANTPNDDQRYNHPLLKAIMLHFMLAYDHPFIDGNGRTARALFYWLLIKTGYWLIEYTSISGIIAQAPTTYYKTFLFTETDEGDMTYFLLHQARVTCEALKKMHHYADEKKREFENFEQIVKSALLNQRQTALIQSFILKREKTMEIDKHKKINNVSYLTARNDLEDLVEKGLVKKKKEGRTSLYTPVKSLLEKLELQ